MRITWVARSFLDYRLPVFKALDELCGHQLILIYNSDKVPERCNQRIKKILGQRAIALDGEQRIGVNKDKRNEQMANVGISLPYHPKLIKTIRASEPDVIVSDGFLKWTYGSLIVRIFNRKQIKHIMCYERTPHTERAAGTFRTLYRKFACKFIDAIDCNGSLTAEYVTKDLGFKKSLAFGHMVADTSGIVESVKKVTDDEVVEIQIKYNLKGLKFIYVGGLIPRKGVMELLQAWKDAALDNASLMLVGEGHQRQEAEKFIKDNNMENVVFTGAVNYDDLGPYYKVADCFIIPTLEDNWSLVVPEAMAAGLPIACSIYNGCHPELVHPENGWTFDPLNIRQTTETLRTIYDNRDRLIEMGEESRRIVANHTPEHAAKALYDMCLKLTGKE